MKQNFATAINCMDGRVQLPVNNWIQKQFGIPYVDTITVAGPDKALAENSCSQLNALFDKIDISKDKHGSKILVVAGHADCAGNPVNDQQHHEHIKKAVSRLKSYYSEELTVVGLWINQDWNVEQVV